MRAHTRPQNTALISTLYNGLPAPLNWSRTEPYA